MKHTLTLASCLGALAVSCGGDGDRIPRSDGGAASEPAPRSGDGAGGTEEEASAETGGRRRGSTSSDLEATDGKPYASAELGALHGEVLFAGEAPERYAIGAKDKPECCTHADADHMSDTVVVNDGRVQYAFVYLRSGFDPEAIPAPPAEPFVLDQRGCVYTPHVAGLQTGRTLHVSNSDPTSHNVRFDALKNGVRGNKTMGQGGTPLEFEFERQENSVKFKCDIHPWMLSWLHVQEHPWFAVTDERGAFTIPDVPPGEYGVEVIHERFGKKRGSVTVTAGESSGFRVTFD